MEDAPAETPAANPPPPPPRRPPPPRHLWGRLRHWTSELVTVFIGVYAAFALNNYQTHRQERQRREQILDWVQSAYAELRDAMGREEAAMRKDATEFDRAVKAGETPRLFAFNYRGDYNPGDFATLLQSGGFDLLEVQTVRDIREVEGTLRQMVAVLQHDQQISDALVLPNLDKPPEFFYDPSTKGLRPSYSWYANFYQLELDYYRTIRGELNTLLKQLQTERERNRLNGKVEGPSTRLRLAQDDRRF